VNLGDHFALLSILFEHSLKLGIDWDLKYLTILTIELPEVVASDIFIIAGGGSTTLLRRHISTVMGY